MEFCHFFLFVMFLVLTVCQFVVKNSIPYSQFLRLRRLCSDDSDFSNKAQEMCQFFEKRGYPASVIQTAHLRAQRKKPR